MSLTFQKLYQITIGQYTSGGGLTSLTVITENRFKAEIKKTAKRTTAKTPPVTSIDIYNLGPEVITALGKAINLYVEIRAGYVFDGDQVYEAEDLPVVYVGSVFFSQTSRRETDIITKLSCTEFNDRAAKAKTNRTFSAGTPVKVVFNHLANTLNMPIRHDWTQQDSKTILKDRVVEGTTMTVMGDWCERYDLRMVSDKGVIKIIDKAVKHVSKFRHTIPLSRIKGYPNISVDLSKALKEKTTPTPDVKVNTFLFPLVSLNDSVILELINYTAPQKAGSYQTEEQEFVVTAYTHLMDSHEGNTWTTAISGKGAQQ